MEHPEHSPHLFLFFLLDAEDPDVDPFNPDEGDCDSWLLLLLLLTVVTDDDPPDP